MSSFLFDTNSSDYKYYVHMKQKIHLQNLQEEAKKKPPAGSSFWKCPLPVLTIVVEDTLSQMNSFYRKAQEQTIVETADTEISAPKIPTAQEAYDQAALAALSTQVWAGRVYVCRGAF